MFKVVKRHITSKGWISRHVNDHYVIKSKELNLRSRSAFKLEEIQERFKILNVNDCVVDLGSSPGGWCISASNYLNFSTGGKLFGIDLLPMEPIKNVTFIKGDFTKGDTQTKLLLAFNEGGKSNLFDVILSDMLSNVSGHHDIDHQRSIELVRSVCLFGKSYLKPGGNLVAKVLEGEDIAELLNSVKGKCVDPNIPVFKSVKMFKPKSSRSNSTEMYLICKNKLTL